MTIHDIILEAENREYDFDYDYESWPFVDDEEGGDDSE